MTHDQQLQLFVMVTWFISTGLWLIYAINGTLAYEEKERKKFEAFIRRMNEK